MQREPITVALRPIAYGTTVLLATAASAANGDAEFLYVETPKECWSYAVGFDLPIAAIRRQGISAGLAVVVDLEVESGRIGLGCLTADGTAFVGSEMTISAGMRR